MHNQSIEGDGEKAGESPMDRENRASNADKAVDSKGIPIGGVGAGAKQPRLAAAGSHPGARLLVGGRSLPEGANIHLGTEPTIRCSPVSVSESGA